MPLFTGTWAGYNHYCHPLNWMGNSVIAASAAHMEKEMATRSSILAWRIPWTEEPGGLQSIGSQSVGHNWATKHALLISNFLQELFKVSVLPFLLLHDRSQHSAISIQMVTFRTLPNSLSKVVIPREVAQSCLTLCDPMDCSPPGSSIHGIF